MEAAAERSTVEGERRTDVRWIRSYVIKDSQGLGSVCLYEADSTEAIERHAIAADLPATEIVPVVDTVVLNPDPSPTTSLGETAGQSS